MIYVSQSDLLGQVPQTFINQALDDNGDGQPDIGVWDSIAETVSRAIDGLFASVYHVPFIAPLPQIVTDAAKVFAAEMLYARRGLADDKNPWAKTADALRLNLPKAIIPGLIRISAPVLISEPAKTTNTTGRMLS